jgi:hypothetical protein
MLVAPKQATIPTFHIVGDNEIRAIISKANRSADLIQKGKEAAGFPKPRW